MFKKEDIQLRSVQASDATLLLEWENNPSNWRVSDRNEPLSRIDMEQFIVNQLNSQEIEQLDQFRYMITESPSGRPLGTLDLYEIDWGRESAYIGILVADPNKRRKGIGRWALELLLEHLYEELAITTAFARIQPENKASQELFQKVGFKKKLEISSAQNEDAEYIEFVCDLENKW